MKSDTIGRRSSVPVSVANEWTENPLSDPSETHSVLLPVTVEELDALEPNVAVMSTHKHLKAELFPSASYFVTGESVSGHFDLQCTSRDVKLRSMSLELYGVEMVKDEEHGDGSWVQHIFMKRVLVLQSPDTPPTDAVMADSMRDHASYWPARKRTTRFAFQFELPEGMPSSFESPAGGVYYTVSTSIEFKTSRETAILRKIRPITVQEVWKEPEVLSPVFASAESVWGMFGGKGQVNLRAEIIKPLVSAGSDAFVRALVQNESHVKVHTINLSLVRRLKTFRKVDVGKLMPVTFERKTLASQKYKNKHFGFEDREVALHLTVPRDAISIRSTRLIEVSYIIQATCSASFSKDIVVEIPLDICHSYVPFRSEVVESAPEVVEAEVEESRIVEVPSSKVKPVDSAFQSEVSLFAESSAPPHDVLSAPNHAIPSKPKRIPPAPPLPETNARERAIAHLNSLVTAEESVIDYEEHSVAAFEPSQEYLEHPASIKGDEPVDEATSQTSKKLTDQALEEMFEQLAQFE